MDLTKLTLAVFLCDGNATMAPAAQDEFEKVKPNLSIGGVLRHLGKGYTIHRFDDQAGDVVLLHDGEPIGCYLGEVLAISADHQGKKLSVPLILQAVAERRLPTKRTMSESGRKVLTLAWKVANGQAGNPWP